MTTDRALNHTPTWDQNSYDIRAASGVLSSYSPSAAAIAGERLQRSLTLMDDEDVDLLVAFSGATLANRGAVRWFTNYYSPDLPAVSIMDGESRLSLIVSYLVEPHWAAELSWCKDVHVANDLVDELLNGLDRYPSTVRIGLIGRDSAPSEVEKVVARRWQCKWVDEAFDAMRLVKTPLEVALTTESADIAARSFESLQSTLVAGLSERDIAAEAQRLLISGGAESTLVLLSSTPAVIQPVASPRVLVEDDLLQISLELAGPAGYWVQTIRMLQVGGVANDVQREAFAGVIASLDAALEVLRPGVRLADVATEAGRVLKPYADSLSAVQQIPFGHSMGLNLAEGFLLDERCDIVARENMIVVIHPNLYAETFGVVCGDTYVVTGDGATKLSGLPLGEVS
jgi:Xaa-Pro aminopeptidase